MTNASQNATTLSMLTFDSLQPGSEVGHVVTRIDAGLTASWFELFPMDKDAELLPPGLAMAVAMRACMTVLADLQLGAVQSQRLRLGSSLRRGDVVSTRISCRAKDIKDGRRSLTVTTDSRSEGDILICQGEITLMCQE